MKHVFLCLFGLAFSQILIAQCSGNLGENIFTDGDFGSGIPNILTPDPQIAPGYTYVTNPPPIDGSYCITNNTTNWGSFASNWNNIGDNSPDPNGYMMIVNASFDPGLFYEQLVDDLCENTLYVFSADIFNIAAGIFPNVSFLIDGTELYNTGNVPYNNQWNTYGFTFTTGPGQTSVNLALQNNAPGGNGNDIALDNITFKVCGPDALTIPSGLMELCENEATFDIQANIVGSTFDNPQIQWQQSLDGGVTWSDIPAANNLSHTHMGMSFGTYYYRYLVANGPANLLNNKCRVISEVVILEVIPVFYNISASICEGLTYELGSGNYTETGIYMETFQSSNGCDSIVTLDLSVISNTEYQAYFTAINPLCYDDANGSIQIDSIVNGSPPYTIEIDGAMDDDGNIDNLTSGSYNYIVTDQSGCVVEQAVTLENPPLFFVELGEDLEVQLGESVEITPFYSSSVEQFEWVADFPIVCGDDCENLELTPTNSSILSLTATTTTGCVASDSIYIQVEKEKDVFIPNAFSPDSDGYNDYLTVYGAEPKVKQIDEFLVFNRWGGLVYTRKNFPPNEVGKGWDGKFKGQLVEPGTFIYVAKVRFLDDQVLIYKGDITLIR